jgi:glycosyltransferase involved in cell wall biosynthesis
MTESEPASSGVSIVIRCHNGRSRLEPTLTHLARQQVPPGVAWEIVLVDNGSTDGTAAFAEEFWRGIEVAPLRVVHAPEPGHAVARYRGIQEARYEIISFIDDDNWVCPEWVNLVHEIMSSHPEVGACGGYNRAVFEGEPPTWFPRYQQRFAVGAQAKEPGDITDVEGVLWGAGLSVRRSAMLRLVSRGFKPLDTGRGEDYEISYALRLVGFRIYYDPRLGIQHYLPAARLKWRYLRRLARENASTKVQRDPYLYLLDPNYKPKPRWWATWQWQTVRAVRPLLRHPIRFVISLIAESEGDSTVPSFEAARGRLGTLLRERESYSARIRSLRNASWLADSREAIAASFEGELESTGAARSQPSLDLDAPGRPEARW